jgi:hypothetical protein
LSLQTGELPFALRLPASEELVDLEAATAGLLQIVASEGHLDRLIIARRAVLCLEPCGGVRPELDAAEELELERGPLLAPGAGGG